MVSIALEIAISPLRLPWFEILSLMLLCYNRKEVFKTLTVLLVEDEPQLLHLIEGILRRNSYSVLTASSPGDALRVSDQHTGKIDVLLTDVVMPGMNGRQLAERVAKARPEMRVLYMSGYTGSIVLRHGVSDAGVAFLQKPITPDVLLRALRDVLDAPVA